VEHFRRARVDASEMTYTELREYVRRLGASGFNVAEQAVNLQHKLAFPAVTIVMTLLAIPFGVTTGKKGALYGIGLAAVLAGAYFLLLTIFMAIGAAGVLPPALAAWGPNILFGSGALFLMLTVRT
jgi:lipopolysaccharide export LptBFGC system permease protein LptF